MERSLIAFEHFREASQKFEYFILGISVALCAYIGQTLQPEKFPLSPYLLQVLALLFIASSAVLALNRLELDVHIRKLNHTSLHHREVLSALAGRGAPFIANDVAYSSRDETVSTQSPSS